MEMEVFMVWLTSVVVVSGVILLNIHWMLS